MPVPWMHRAAAAAGVIALGGCQLVFGIDAYETDGAEDGGGGAGPGGGGSGGLEGGADATGGAGPDCACDVQAVWSPVELAVQGAGDEPLPTQCGDGSAPLVLFDGRPSVGCSSCSCTPGGCALPELVCHSQGSCQGSATSITPSASCTAAPSGGCASFSLAGPVGAPNCDVIGGQPDAGTFERFVAFCASTECGPGCAHVTADCVAAAGLPAAECPAGFGERYVLDDGGVASCEPCSCAGSCDGAPYTAGLFVCDAFDVDDSGCASPGYTSFQARASLGRSCTVNHTATYPGVFEVSGQHTVCCRAPIEGVDEPR